MGKSSIILKQVLNKIFPFIMLLNNETILWYYVSERDVLCTSLHINYFPVFALLATTFSCLHGYATLYVWAKDMLHIPSYLLKIRNQLYQHHSKAVRNYKLATLLQVPNTALKASSARKCLKNKLYCYLQWQCRGLSRDCHQRSR